MENSSQNWVSKPGIWLTRLINYLMLSSNIRKLGVTYIYFQQLLEGKINQGDIEYKEGAIGFPYTLLWRFWTSEELVSA